VKANDEAVFADFVGWRKIGPNNEPEPPPPFSTWRGIAPEGYTTVGDFFVLGNCAPTPKQTAGFKAIREDLVRPLQPQHLIWEGRQAWSTVTLWDVLAVPLILIGTGAFVSSDGREVGDNVLNLLLFTVAGGQS
jgi:hypothetical protein